MTVDLIDAILDELDKRRALLHERAVEKGYPPAQATWCACVGPAPRQLKHHYGVQRCACERRKIAEILEIAASLQGDGK